MYLERKLALASRSLEEAYAIFEENRIVANQKGLPHFEAQALNNLVIVAIARGDLELEQNMCQSSIEIASRAFDARDLAIAEENLAVVAHLPRHHAQAWEGYLRVFRRIRALGNPAMLVRLGRNIGELCLSFGDVSADFLGPGA
ncbi:MAG: hypothetical protein NZM37_05020 [Sandaracinaceae bacterium]|nr:hypothetical protein [Sandaracinaceae bacterium]MDW8246413.1 hypothetical protein [Sandaracinaceae bacterium]